MLQLQTHSSSSGSHMAHIGTCGSEERKDGTLLHLYAEFDNLYELSSSPTVVRVTV